MDKTNKKVIGYKKVVHSELNGYLNRFKDQNITDQQRADAWMLIATAVDTIAKLEELSDK